MDTLVTRIMSKCKRHGAHIRNNMIIQDQRSISVRANNGLYDISIIDGLSIKSQRGVFATDLECIILKSFN